LARLQNAEKAIIDGEKLYGYILSSTHPVGRFKADFFRKQGYTAENWKDFERSLRECVASQDAIGVEESSFGRKYVVEWPLTNPSGDIVKIVTVWVILKGEVVPRFVTAYPGGL
jgi:hypothetical protein